ncbi:hypothetical protein M758_3G164900 [Ceratodon purpureus]|nr:hypothetical protein M758_3G164900 [Ceratodon purpureus]
MVTENILRGQIMPDLYRTVILMARILITTQVSCHFRTIARVQLVACTLVIQCWLRLSYADTCDYLADNV